MVGARGFEPPTPWSRTSGKQRILLARLAFLWIIVGLFPCCSGVFGPKLDLSFEVNPSIETNSLGTLAVFIQPSVADPCDEAAAKQGVSIAHLGRQLGNPPVAAGATP